MKPSLHPSRRGIFLGCGRVCDAAMEPALNDRRSDLERPLPCNLDAERSVLGAVLMNNTALTVAIKNVYPEDFFLDQHRRVFIQMIAMRARQQPIDLVTLTEELQRHGDLEAAGGAPYLASLADGMPKVSNVEHYSRIVKDKATLRNLIHAAHSIQQQAFEGEGTAGAIAGSMIANLTGFATESRGTEPLIITAVEDLLSRQIKPREMLLDPILPQQGLAMLYAYRGVGKTYVALGIAAAIASGGHFLRWSAPKPRRGLYIDGELPEATLKERTAMVIDGMEGPELIPGALSFVTPDEQKRAMPDLSTSQGQALVEPHLDGVEFVVVDNLSALCREGVENEGESWLTVQDWGLRLRRHGVTVLFVHHAGKNKTQRGTSRREDLLDTVIALRHPADYQASDGLRCEVYFEKTRSMMGEAAKPFEIRLSSGTDGRAVWTVRDLTSDSLEAASILFSRGSSVRYVASELGITKSVAGRLRQRWEVAPK
jgi:DnaB-like helicase N terminal domain/AAA domain